MDTNVAALVVVAAFLAFYVYVVRKPRVLAVLFFLSFFSFPLIWILAIPLMMLFGAPLAWHVAGRLLGRSRADASPESSSLSLRS